MSANNSQASLTITPMSKERLLSISYLSLVVIARMEYATSQLLTFLMSHFVTATNRALIFYALTVPMQELCIRSFKLTLIAHL